jgi:hypothetical protein
VSALLLGAFAVLKTYAVGHFSLTTGSALLSAAPLSVLLGSLMSYAYWAFPLAAVAAVYQCVNTVRRSGWHGEAMVLLGVAFVAAALSPGSYLLQVASAFLLFLLIVWAVTRLHRRRPGKARSTSVLLHARVFFVFAVVALILGTAPRLWVPVELLVVNTEGQRTVVVGTVLGLDDGDWMSVMRAGDRGLMRIKSDDILSRQLCHLTDAQPPGERPVMWWVIGRERDPANTGCGILASRHRPLPVMPGSFPRP